MLQTSDTSGPVHGSARVRATGAEAEAEAEAETLKGKELGPALGLPPAAPVSTFTDSRAPAAVWSL